MLLKRMIRTLIGNSDAVICLSQSWYDYFQQNYKTKKLLVLPNIIDDPEIHGGIKKNNEITFLFLGLVCEEKGIFNLVDVIADNKEKYRNKIKLLIGGNGKTKQLTDLIKKNQLEDMIEFLGWIDNKKKIIVLNKADVYILPSYIEGLPVSVLEAMSYGMAVISTNVGGIPEIVKNKENGLLIEPGNLKQIEESMDCLLENPELIKLYGNVSRQRVQKHLPDPVVEQLINIYQSVLINE